MKEKRIVVLLYSVTQAETLPMTLLQPYIMKIVLKEPNTNSNKLWSPWNTEEPRNSAFQWTNWFYALLPEMPYWQYIVWKEIWDKHVVIGGIPLLRGSSVCHMRWVWQQQPQIQTKPHIPRTKLPTTTKPTPLDSPTHALLESTVMPLQMFLQMLQMFYRWGKRLFLR